MKCYLSEFTRSTCSLIVIILLSRSSRLNTVSTSVQLLNLHDEDRISTCYLLNGIQEKQQ